MSSLECRLCGLGCGAHPILHAVGHEELPFCCLGCMNVFLILSESGILQSGQDLRDTEIFQRSLALGLVAQGESKTGEPSVVEAEEGAGQELVLRLSGLWCTSCAWLIEHVLRAQPGILSARVSFASDLVTVQFMPQRFSPQQVIASIRQIGYGACEYTGEHTASQPEQRDLLLRLGIAAFLWANIMSLSLAIYAGYLEPVAPSVRHYLPFVLMALAIPVLTYCAAPIFRIAWHGLRRGIIRMETLIAVGTLAAFGYSTAAAFRGGRHFYFDTVSVIITLVLAGKVIERGAKQKATRWISTLHQYMPKKARVIANRVERFVTVESLQPGALLLIKPGERIPADGIVLEGDSHADESLLTGESTPVPKTVSSAVVAGSVNLGGVLQVRTTRTSEQSVLAQIIAHVEHALSTRSPVERRVDRVSRVFVPLVMLVAVATFLWLALHGYSSSEAIMRAIAVLIIACPCALGLATPLAVTSAMGVASRNGVLIADSSLLERLQRMDTIVLDKTGTVTQGAYSLVAMKSLKKAAALETVPATIHAAHPGELAHDLDDDLQLAASLEQYSEHPLASALVAAAREQRLDLQTAHDIKIHAGCGLSGNIHGEPVFIGSRKLLDEMGIPAEEHWVQSAAALQARGNTVSFFGRSGIVRALCVFGDRLKPESGHAVERLRQQGFAAHLVSGDSQATTRYIAGQLAIDRYSAEIDPLGKARILEQLQADGHSVVAVGDGINDAPMLAHANLGIAMGSGTDLAMKAAGIILMDNRLDRIPFVLELARRTLRIIQQNLFWAFVYNCLGIALAITGILNPILAALAMLLSSVSILANTTRIYRVQNSDARY